MFDGVEDDVSTTCSASSIAINGPLSYGRKFKFLNVWPATVIRIELCVLLNILAFDGSGAVRETKKGRRCGPAEDSGKLPSMLRENLNVRECEHAMMST